MTVHLTATHVETGDTYEAVLDNGDYCLVTHGAPVEPPKVSGYRSVTLTKTPALQTPGAHHNTTGAP